MGASSRSPSPMTITPSIASSLSAVRMASTAAWSAAFSSPRPARAQAAIAASSATRTASITKPRSRVWVVIIISKGAERAMVGGFSDARDANYARGCDHGRQGGHGADGPGDGRLGRDVGGEDDRHAAGAFDVLLQETVDRDAGLGERLGDRGDHARLVADDQAHIGPPNGVGRWDGRKCLEGGGGALEDRTPRAGHD